MEALLKEFDESENWKIVKYDENYLINSIGEIFSLRNNKKLKLSKWTSGYYFVIFRTEGRKQTKSIHRLLYEHFIGEIPKGYCIDHIDNDRTNNSLSNLRLCTRRENSSFDNRNVTNNTGEHNIWYDKIRDTFRVRFSVKKTKKSFGSYKKLADAIKVRNIIFKKLLTKELAW